MMANNELILNEIIVQNIDNEYELRRDSFCGRFCYDLIEFILNYLSIEDKIRFECVSKKWKKLIFNKQKRLDINEFSYRKKNDLFKVLNVSNIFINGNVREIKTIEIKTLENVLKKFKFLNHFSLIIENYDIKNKNEVLNAVTDNCDHLKSIKCDFIHIDSQTLNKFGHKFGQQLKKIDFLWGYNGFASLGFYKTNVIKMFHNLSVIKEVEIEELVDEKEVLVKSIAKLIDCSINYTSKHDLFNFKLFADNNYNTIISLNISAHFNNPNDRNDLLKQISVMKMLKELSISSNDCDYYLNSFSDGMKLIADNCKQLKELEFRLIEKKSFDIKHAFESFANFTSLTKLRFCVPSSHTEDEEQNEYRIDCLINCKQLKHLTLSSQGINDNLFVGIDSIVPQLKQLYVENYTKISDKALDSISKLKHLEEVNLRTSFINGFKSITDLGLICVINNCQNLNTIYFSQRPNITHKTIDALKEKADKNPRIYFKHYFSTINEESDDFTAYDPKSDSSLPINLKISY